MPAKRRKASKKFNSARRKKSPARESARRNFLGSSALSQGSSELGGDFGTNDSVIESSGNGQAKSYIGGIAGLAAVAGAGYMLYKNKYSKNQDTDVDITVDTKEPELTLGHPFYDSPITLKNEFELFKSVVEDLETFDFNWEFIMRTLIRDAKDTVFVNGDNPVCFYVPPTILLDGSPDSPVNSEEERTERVKIMKTNYVLFCSEMEKSNITSSESFIKAADAIFHKFSKKLIDRAKSYKEDLENLEARVEFWTAYAESFGFDKYKKSSDNPPVTFRHEGSQLVVEIEKSFNPTDGRFAKLEDIVKATLMQGCAFPLSAYGISHGIAAMHGTDMTMNNAIQRRFRECHEKAKLKVDGKSWMSTLFFWNYGTNPELTTWRSDAEFEATYKTRENGKDFLMAYYFMSFLDEEIMKQLGVCYCKEFSEFVNHMAKIDTPLLFKDKHFESTWKLFLRVKITDPTKCDYARKLNTALNYVATMSKHDGSDAALGQTMKYEGHTIFHVDDKHVGRLENSDRYTPMHVHNPTNKQNKDWRWVEAIPEAPGKKREFDAESEKDYIYTNGAINNTVALSAKVYDGIGYYASQAMQWATRPKDTDEMPQTYTTTVQQPPQMYTQQSSMQSPQTPMYAAQPLPQAQSGSGDWTPLGKQSWVSDGYTAWKHNHGPSMVSLPDGERPSHRHIQKS